MAQPVLIAAVDLGPQTARVLYHAVAFARLLDATVKVVHVASAASAATHEHVLNTCLREGPYQMDFGPDNVVVRTGRVSEMIAREAQRDRARLVVMGSRGHNGVASLFVGSTSEAVLRAATTPVLLVPPTDMDIVSLGDTVALTCGPVIAAVDLDEHCEHQLWMASLLAHVGAKPLILMTVARSRTTDHDAALELRRRAHGLEPRRPVAMIVRRGRVAEEIARCASLEGAGLVVMGLRATPKCQPGGIASAVLKTKKAFVLAVPGC
jgi:nucleotide-binding universal stress UspA family protein